MSILQALVRLHAIQTWRRLPRAPDGRPYGPGFFAKRRWAATLNDENRRVTIRLARLSRCLRCEGLLDAGSTGDHLVPLSRGGPVGAQNYLPLCRSCNASKGRKDFLAWWQSTGRGVDDLPNDALTAYVRLRYQAEMRSGDHSREAEPSLVAAVMTFEPLLPTTAHWRAIMVL